MEKFIPVVVIKELSETDKIMKALKNNGINCAEITFRTACAAEAIAYAAKNYPDMEIGAGTVINAAQCNLYRFARAFARSCKYLQREKHPLLSRLRNPHRDHGST